MFLEIKDCSLGLTGQKKFSDLPSIVAQKVRDSLAGILGGLYYTTCKDEKRIFSKSYQQLASPPQVVFLYQGLSTPANNAPKQAASKRGILLKQLKGRLKWLTSNVRVVGLSDYKMAINGLKIRQQQNP